jgi:hypothetical protein
MDLTYIGCDGVTWINLAQRGGQWRAFVNTVMNIWFHKIRGIYWLSWATVGFSSNFCSTQSNCMYFQSSLRIPWTDWHSIQHINNMRKLDTELNLSSAIGSTFTFVFSFLPFPGDAEGYYNETGSPFLLIRNCLLTPPAAAVVMYKVTWRHTTLFLSSVGPFPWIPWHQPLMSSSARSQNCEKRLLTSSCLSLCPLGTTIRLPHDGFARNLVYEHFSKICRQHSPLIETWQE